MKEKQTTVEQAAGQSVAPTVSHGPLFGGLLFSLMLLLAGVALGMMGWGMYRGWRLSQEQAVLPSIALLPGEAAPLVEEKIPPTSTPAVPAPEEHAAETLKKAQETEIKVLNGGAAKGSATVVTTMLKKTGYIKVTTGNTIGDYTGVVVYFAPSFEAVATGLKETLTQSYPKVETKPALKENKETTQAPLTVILGK